MVCFVLQFTMLHKIILMLFNMDKRINRLIILRKCILVNNHFHIKCAHHTFLFPFLARSIVYKVSHIFKIALLKIWNFNAHAARFFHLATDFIHQYIAVYSKDQYERETKTSFIDIVKTILKVKGKWNHEY